MLEGAWIHGDWQYMKELFAEIERENADTEVTYGTMLKGILKYEGWEKALQFFRTIHNTTFATEVTFNTMLYAAVELKKSLDARWLFTKAQRFGKADVWAYNIMLKGLLAQGHWQKALSLFDSAALVDKVTYATMLEGALMYGDWQYMKELFEKAKESNSVDAVTYGAMLKGAVKHSNWNEALQFFRTICDAGLATYITYNTMLCAAVELKQWPDAEWLFKELQCLGKTNKWAYNIMLNGLLVQGDSQKGQRLFQEALNLQKANVVTTNTMLNGLIKLDKWELAQLCFFDAKKAMRIDSETFSTMLNGAVKLKKWRYAQQLFVEAKKSNSVNAVTYGTMINGALLCDDLQKALDLFTEAKNAKLINVVTYGTIINGALQYGDWQGALQLFEEADDAGLATHITFLKMLDAAVELKEWKGTFELFAEARNLGKANEWAYNIMLKGLLAQGHWQKALSLFEEALNLEKTNVVTYNTMLNGAVKLKKWRYAQQLFNDGEKSASFNAVTYRTMINGALRCGDWQKALTFFDAAQRTVSILQVTYETMLKGALKSHNWREVLQFFRTIRDERVVTHATFNIILNAAAELKQWKDTVWLFAEAQNLEKADKCTYNVMLKGLLIQGKSEEAQRLFKKAQNLKIADEWTYNIMLKGLLGQGHWQIALTLFAEAQNLEKADVVTTNTMLGGLLKLNKWDDAQLCFLEAKKAKRIDSETFNTMLNGAVKLKKWRYAQELFAEAIGSNSVDVVTYGTMINAVLLCGDWQKALGLFTEAKQAKLINAVTYGTMINAVLRSGDWQKALDLFTEAKEAKLINAVTYGTMINGSLRYGDWQKVLSLFAEAKNAKLINTRIYGTVLDGAIQNESPQTVEQLFCEAKTIGLTNKTIYAKMMKLYLKTKNKEGADAFMRMAIKDKKTSPYLVSTYASLFGSAGKYPSIHKFDLDPNPLGHGAFGTVYKATWKGVLSEDSKVAHTVAIKRLSGFSSEIDIVTLPYYNERENAKEKLSQYRRPYKCILGKLLHSNEEVEPHRLYLNVKTAKQFTYVYRISDVTVVHGVMNAEQLSRHTQQSLRNRLRGKGQQESRTTYELSETECGTDLYSELMRVSGYRTYWPQRYLLGKCGNDWKVYSEKLSPTPLLELVMKLYRVRCKGRAPTKPELANEKAAGRITVYPNQTNTGWGYSYCDYNEKIHQGDLPVKLSKVFAQLTKRSELCEKPYKHVSEELSQKVIEAITWYALFHDNKISTEKLKSLEGKRISICLKNYFERKQARAYKNFIEEVTLMSSDESFQVCPELVHYYGLCVDEKPYWLVMEYISGGSLRSNLRRICHDEIQIVKLGLDIAKGLAYLHNSPRQIIHFDLKSDNVLLQETDDGYQAKVADFGLSKRSGSIEGLRSMFLGTPGWSAPEVFEAKALTAAVDVYSYGTTLWEMCTGKRPWQGCDFKSIRKAVCAGKRPVISEGVSEFLKALIHECWSAVPEERPSMDEVVRRLEQRLSLQETFEELISQNFPVEQIAGQRSETEVENKSPINSQTSVRGSTMEFSLSTDKTSSTASSTTSPRWFSYEATSAMRELQFKNVQTPFHLSSSSTLLNRCFAFFYNTETLIPKNFQTQSGDTVSTEVVRTEYKDYCKRRTHSTTGIVSKQS